jgi:hypothetical protein
VTPRRDRHPLRVGALLWPQRATWPELRYAARAADAAGLDSPWTWDHLHAIVGDFLGPEEHVAEMRRPYLELGFTHLIADSPAPFDHETIERLPRLRALMAGA